MTQYANYKVHTKNTRTISNGELSDPICDGVYRGLTLVRLRERVILAYYKVHAHIFIIFQSYILSFVHNL